MNSDGEEEEQSFVNGCQLTRWEGAFLKTLLVRLTSRGFGLYFNLGCLKPIRRSLPNPFWGLQHSVWQLLAPSCVISQRTSAKRSYQHRLKYLEIYVA